MYLVSGFFGGLGDTYGWLADGLYVCAYVCLMRPDDYLRGSERARECRPVMAGFPGGGMLCLYIDAP